MNFFSMRSCSPWVVGAAIGMLSWFSFVTVNKPIGITTAFEYTAPLATRAVAPATAQSNPYYSTPEKSPKIDWEWMLVLGVFAGAFASSRLSGRRSPSRHAGRNGSEPPRASDSLVRSPVEHC